MTESSAEGILGRLRRGLQAARLNLPSCERKAAQANIIRYYQTFNLYLFVLFVQKRDVHDIYVNPIKNQQKMTLLAALEALLAALGRSWAALGRSWPLLGRSWLTLGGSWALLGRSWGVKIDLQT